MMVAAMGATTQERNWTHHIANLSKPIKLPKTPTIPTPMVAIRRVNSCPLTMGMGGAEKDKPAA